MAANYVLLNSQQLTSSAASVTFSNIPQSGYTDLKVVMSARNSGTDVDNIITLNSTNKTSSIRLYGNGSATASDTAVGGGLATPSSATASTFSSTEYYFPNYLGTSQKNVSIDAVNETNGTSAYSNLSTQLFNLTTAVNGITITPNSGSFVQYSTFSLYGLAAVGTTPTVAPKAAGGNIVTTDGTYWYHAFTTSGYFTPVAGITCDYLVVAGGGGGAGRGSGGGGAGGYRTATSAALTAQNYAVTIGAGGIAGTGTSTNDSATNGTNGSDSIFSSTTSTGGGRGGGTNGQNGLSGGSGGGGGADANSSGGAASPVTSPVQGYAGGNGTNGQSAAAGGGGAGGNTNTAPVSGGRAGNGGGGSNSVSSWATATGTGVSGYYAGGGGGGCWDNRTAGTGGAGGGGAGGTNNVLGTAGTANTGGGGGGGGHVGTSGDGSAGGNGGSGIVIIRYAV